MERWRRTMKFESRCKDCGELATLEERKSNSNWKVYKKKCEKCGGETQLKLKGGGSD